MFGCVLVEIMTVFFEGGTFFVEILLGFPLMIYLFLNTWNLFMLKFETRGVQPVSQIHTFLSLLNSNENLENFKNILRFCQKMAQKMDKMSIFRSETMGWTPLALVQGWPTCGPKRIFSPKLEARISDFSTFWGYFMRFSLSCGPKSL
jgi:hypothetical protein